MMRFDRFHLVWLTGANCDGCTIKALGETTEGGLEALLQGRPADLPTVKLLHPILSYESGREFVRQLERAERGELEPYGIINEAAIPDDESVAPAFYSSLGAANHAPMPFGEWLSRLAPGALFIVAWGDCAVWGGPQSLAPNPSGSTGTAMHLGVDFRSTLGLPVVNLPGCAPQTILISLLAELLRHAQGLGPAPELDDTNRPRSAYGPEGWEGALGTWQS